MFQLYDIILYYIILDVLYSVIWKTSKKVKKV